MVLAQHCDLSHAGIRPGGDALCGKGVYLNLDHTSAQFVKETGQAI